MKIDVKDVEVQELKGKDGLKLAIMIYNGSGDPVIALDNAVKQYVRKIEDKCPSCGAKKYEEEKYNEFIDANMDNPWVRIIMIGKLY